VIEVTLFGDGTERGLCASSATSLPRTSGQRDGAALLLPLYSFQRDELQTLDDARHLAYGYVAYPSLTPLFGRLSLTLFGTSLRGFRVAGIGSRAPDVRAHGAAIGDGYSRAIRTTRGRVTLSHAQGLFPIMGQKFIAILKIILLLSAVSVPRAFAAVHPAPLEKNVDAAKCIECPRACDLHHNGLARQNTRHPYLVGWAAPARQT
jgi:hypothetical protein